MSEALGGNRGRGMDKCDTQKEKKKEYCSGRQRMYEITVIEKKRNTDK